MRTQNGSCLLIALVAVIYGVVGCNQNQGDIDFAEASGQVLLDGAPLANATVDFIPLNVKANEQGLGGSGGMANTDADGRFEMYTASNEGVQPGVYQVKISKISEAQQASEDARIQPGQEVVPPRYNNKTELEVEIPESGKTDLKFELTSS